MDVADELRQRAAQLRDPDPGFTWVSYPPVLGGEECAAYRRSVAGAPLQRMLSSDAQMAFFEYVGIGLTQFNDKLAADPEDVACLLEKTAANL